MKLFSQRDAEAYAKTGAKEFRFNAETRITPGAKDHFSEVGIKVIFDGGTGPAPSGPGAGTPSAVSHYRTLFNSHEAQELKRQICEIGRRLWQREYTDGNGGNISARLGPNEFICTPTGVSKGFMTPEMLCLVDGEGTQLAGTWKRTSEITTHLAIYRGTPEAKSVVHAHPVHATAFAITGFEPPGCLIPEIEVFVGRVPIAPYRTPGSKEMAEVIQPLAAKHQSIMMGNHGLICWGISVEDAYFKMEITDAYCRTLWIASFLPNRGTSIPGDKMAELLEMKKGLGLPDDRLGLKPVQLCEIDPWEAMREGRSCTAPSSLDSALEKMSPAELEALVQQVTDHVVAALGNR